MSASALHAARQAVRALPLAPGSRVVVACSGGQDSLALAGVVAQLAPALGWVASAVVVDHGIRAASAADADEAAHRVRAIGLDVDVVKAHVSGGPAGTGAGGPEAAARTARYAILSDYAADATVLLGHTMDDQAETVLLGLGRGSGARSLAGMSPWSPPYARPFLSLRRTQTAEICQHLGLEPVLDPSNEIDGPWRRADGGPLRRNAIRHQAIPALEDALGPGVVEALARTADMLRRDTEYFDAVVAEELHHLGWVDGAQEWEIEVSRLASLDDALRTRVIHAVIVAMAPPGLRAEVTSVHVRAIDALIVNYHGQGEAQLPGVTAARRRGRLFMGVKR